ncbi:probable two-component response regulator [Oceanobacter sp. RED65]|uniref:diguanylate cyclase n=2 Tax=Bermanella marisrubri TaxID=207949 RepID=Q1N3P2_9GAMM|nr:probable two-component response regulator [Oceanobacter sp. RED65] [Bermanella marisrubri]
MDFLQRSIPGVLIYAFMWPMLAWGMEFNDRAPTFSYTFSTLFIVTSILRLAHGILTQPFYAANPNAWRMTMYVLAFIHSCTLALLFILVLIIPEYRDLAMAVALIVVGLLSGASASLSPKPIFTQFYIGSLAFPATLVSFLVEEFRFLSPLFAATWIYFIFLGRRFYNEYQRAFHIEMRLKENQVKLERLNETDTLTGIYNRQYFDNALDMQWDLASRSENSLSILFLDLDHFKKINDNFGHLAGDQVLCHAAHLFSEIARRKTDMIARYGGEEFAIILPATEKQDALDLAEQIRHAIENTPCRSDQGLIHLTVSIGVNSVVPSPQGSPVTFLDQADQALYQAKNNGRNQIMFAAAQAGSTSLD